MAALPAHGGLFGDKYIVEGELGGGAVGVVYAATHKELRQRVAIKVLRDAAQTVASERMIREARVFILLQSEHVVRVMDVGRTDGRAFIVMEHLSGSDLGSALRERGRFKVPEAVDYVLQACAGIAEAHARGIVHRDLKPSNLFLTRRADGSPLVKVLDFGISKQTESGDVETSLTGPAEVLGSPMYMSPEQIRHASEVDHRTDVWSLGVILFRFLSGAAPFDAGGGGVSGMLAAVVGDAPRSLLSLAPDVPRGLEPIIMRCLAKPPGERWSSIGELAGALAPFGTEDGRAAVVRITRQSVEASGPHRILRPEKPRARWVWPALFGVAFAVAAVLVAVLATRAGATNPETEAPPRAPAVIQAETVPDPPAATTTAAAEPSAAPAPSKAGATSAAVAATTAPLPSHSARTAPRPHVAAPTQALGAPTSPPPTHAHAPATDPARAAATNERY